MLFTCAGQRVDIVTEFGRAGATTIVADADRLAPSLYHADHYALVPRVSDAAYVPALADPALRRRIGQAARQRVTEYCSWDRVTEKTLEVYAAAVPKPADATPGDVRPVRQAA